MAAKKLATTTPLGSSALPEPPKKKRRGGPSGRSLTTAERKAMGQDQLSTWVPNETRARFDALKTRLGLTAPELILRALDALEERLRG